MSDERQDDEIEDLELQADEVDDVVGGDANTQISSMKTKHDTVKQTISNIH